MQYVVVDSATGQPVYRSDGQPLAIALPEGNYAIEWLERPVAWPVNGYLSREQGATQPLLVNIAVTGEGGPDYVIQVPVAVADRLKDLLAAYMESGDWANEINDILDGAHRISTIGTVNTAADDGGWFPKD